MDFFSKCKNRASVRKFLPNKPLNKEDLNKILEIIQTAPTSHNLFSSSAIVITDFELIQKLGDLLNQKQVKDCSLFIIFAADYNRLNAILKEEAKNYLNSTNDLLVAAGDAFIQATMAQTMAIELNLGTCFIGGVRAKIKELNDILELNNKAFPVVGLAIGYPEKEHFVLPKMNRIYLNKYNFGKNIEQEISEYQKIFNNHFKKIINKDVDYINHTAKSIKRIQPEYVESDILIEKIMDLRKGNK